MSPIPRLILLALCLLLHCCGKPAAHDPVAHDPSTLIKPLIEPAKLATLGERGANPRVQKITAILWQAKQDDHDPAKVVAATPTLSSWSERIGDWIGC